MLALGVKELSEEIDDTLGANPLLQEISPVNPVNDNSAYADRFENLATKQTQSFEDHLIRQLGFLHLDSDDYVAACIIISCLDDNGYLTLSNQTLISEFKNQNITISPQRLESAINCVRQLDPAGLASTDLADCLIQQLQRYHKQSEIYEDAVLLCEHLTLLADDPDTLTIRLGIAPESIASALTLIKQLNPSPTRSFDQGRN